jgi:hypothetical protein
LLRVKTHQLRHRLKNSGQKKLCTCWRIVRQQKRGSMRKILLLAIVTPQPRHLGLYRHRQRSARTHHFEIESCNERRNCLVKGPCGKMVGGGLVWAGSSLRIGVPEPALYTDSGTWTQALQGEWDIAIGPPSQAGGEPTLARFVPC